MKYLLLLRSNREVWETLGEDGQQALYTGYGAFHQWVGQSGFLVDASPLATDATTTVRVRGGDTVTTDGPFAETKEHLVGYYLLDCLDLDVAIDAAARIPDAGVGSIEVMPLAGLPADFNPADMHEETP